MWPKDHEHDVRDMLRPPPPSQAATPYARQQEDARNMAAYDAAVEARAEERQRGAAQAELTEHLSRRGAAYLDATGEAEVPRSVLEDWRGEFVGDKLAAQEADRKRREDATRGKNL